MMRCNILGMAVILLCGWFFLAKASDEKDGNFYQQGSSGSDRLVRYIIDLDPEHLVTGTKAILGAAAVLAVLGRQGYINNKLADTLAPLLVYVASGLMVTMLGAFSSIAILGVYIAGHAAPTYKKHLQ